MMSLIKSTKQLFISLNIALLLLCNSALADIAVIAHVDNTAALNAEDLRLRFLGRALSPHSTAQNTTPVNLPFGHPSRVLFDREILGKSEANVRTYWARMIFTSRARPPFELSQDDKVLEFVKTHENAVGYINSELVTDEIRVIFTLKSSE